MWNSLLKNDDFLLNNGWSHRAWRSTDVEGCVPGWGTGQMGLSRAAVRFLLKNLDFRLKNGDFSWKNVDVVMNCRSLCSSRRGLQRRQSCWSSGSTPCGAAVSDQHRAAASPCAFAFTRDCLCDAGANWGNGHAAHHPVLEHDERWTRPGLTGAYQGAPTWGGFESLSAFQRALV